MNKLRLIIRLILAKKYLLITSDEDDNKMVFYNYHPSEVSMSGNAIYIHKTAKAHQFAEPTYN